MMRPKRQQDRGQKSEDYRKHYLTANGVDARVDLRGRGRQTEHSLRAAAQRHGDIQEARPERTAHPQTGSGAACQRSVDFGPAAVILHARGLGIGIGDHAAIRGDPGDARSHGLAQASKIRRRCCTVRSGRQGAC
jgi:hypothetical protein